MQMTLMGKKYDVAVGSCCSPEERGKYITIPIDGKNFGRVRNYYPRDASCLFLVPI